MRFRILAALVAAAAVSARAETVVIDHAVVHPVSSPLVEDGRVVVQGDRIVAVGAASEVALPPGGRVIDAAGRHLWPGMTDALSRLGLTEIGSVRGTRDVTETGQINPNSRAEVAVNASSSHFPVTRANGILLAVTMPQGSLVPGTGAVIALDGWTWEEMVRRAPVGLAIQWPGMGPTVRPGEEEESEEEIPAWEERLARLDEMLEEARAYERAVDETPASRGADVRWESLRSVVDGEIPVWIHATTRTQIRAALDWTERQGLEMVLVDGSGGTGGDAWQLAGELAERDIPVVVQTTRFPARVYEPYDTAFTAPSVLNAAGVRILFGSWNSAHARDLPQEAARAVAFGLPRAAAEQALTLGAAQVLGLDDRYGSIESGKSATMILVDGDLLETRMHVDAAWIDGRPVDLESRHTRLWKKWSGRPMPAGRDR